MIVAGGNETGVATSLIWGLLLNCDNGGHAEFGTEISLRGLLVYLGQWGSREHISIGSSVDGSSTPQLYYVADKEHPSGHPLWCVQAQSKVHLPLLLVYV